MDAGQHAACVDAWLDQASGASADELVLLLEAGLGAIWARTKTTLGEVTLTAIAERVLQNASERSPLFAALRVEPTVGFQCGELRGQVGAADPRELVDGVRFIVVEFLTVLGNLTAEILSADLHAALSKVTWTDKGTRTNGHDEQNGSRTPSDRSAKP